MLTRAVFSEGDAARPTTASQPPGRARKTSKHYRSRWQGRSYSAAGLRGKAVRATGSPGHGCWGAAEMSASPGVRGGMPVPGSISKSIGWQCSALASAARRFAGSPVRPRPQFWTVVSSTPTALASWRCVRPRQRRTSASRAPIFASMSASTGTLTTHSLPASASMRRGDETRKRFSARWESAWGREKAPSSGGRGLRVHHAFLTFLLSKTIRGARIGSRKKGPPKPGAKGARIAGLTRAWPIPVGGNRSSAVVRIAAIAR